MSHLKNESMKQSMEFGSPERVSTSQYQLNTTFSHVLFPSTDNSSDESNVEYNIDNMNEDSTDDEYNPNTRYLPGRTLIELKKKYEHTTYILIIIGDALLFMHYIISYIVILMSS